jgi:plasmid stabilization system protein ParE
MSYSLLRSSRHELAAIAQWYEDRRDDLGREFLVEFEHCMSQVVRRPKSFAVEEHAPTGSELRQIAMRRFPYRVIYRASEGRIVVFAIAHSSRKPDYWIDRLEEE